MAAEHDAAATPPRTSAEVQLEELIRLRFEHVMRRFPVFATSVGLHEHDHRLADGTRDALEQDILDTRHHLAQLQALDEAQLGADARVERDLAMHGARLQLFDDEVHRVWQRRTSGADELGDGVYLLFARGSRTFEERLAAICGRLEATPRALAEQRTRLGDRPMRLWNELEIQVAGSLPTLFSAVRDAATTTLPDDHALIRRLDAARDTAGRALDDYSAWLRERLAHATDDFMLGAAEYESLVELRAFDGLSGDDILEVGRQQLADTRAARRAVAAEIDAGASEAEVLDRVKSDHPPDFAASLELYRQAMHEARQFVIDNGLATVPAGEKLSVVATPEYLRRSMPFAAYFSPARFDPQPEGIYVVTPSVDGDARALREHNRASIYNTSIHEAYPGHHLQLTVANSHPSLARPLIDAPEFVEGWAMYSEQMMREEGFDTSPEHRLMMHTDAIWRACRIILDVRLHRGEIGLDEATDFLIEQTGFERPNARAEVERYTYTPTYQLSYLLGKVLLLRLRRDERARLGSDFSLGAFHDALLSAGSIPVSFHRRILAAGDGAAGRVT